MEFYIGQRVVCVESHPLGEFKEGQEFIVKSIKRNTCCGILLLNIGVVTDYEFSRCTTCGRIDLNEDYYNSKRFRPLQELSNTTYNEVMEWLKKGNPIEQLN